MLTLEIYLSGGGVVRLTGVIDYNIKKNTVTQKIDELRIVQSPHAKVHRKYLNLDAIQAIVEVQR